MHILSLTFDLSIHNSVNSWPNHSKFLSVVVESKREVPRDVKRGDFWLNRYYAIHVKCMYILSLFYGLSIHNSFSSCPNHVKFSTVVVDKGTSGCSSITSSIYLNWNISVIYNRIKIKLILEKAEWRCPLFRKNYFLKSLPVSQTWRH